MNGVTHRLMSSGCAPKNPVIPVTSVHSLRADALSDRGPVWNVAQRARCAMPQSRSGGQQPSMPTSGDDPSCDSVAFSAFSRSRDEEVRIFHRKHVIWSSKVMEGRPWVYYTCPRRLGTIRSSLAHSMRHRNMWLLKNVTFTLATDPPRPAPTLTEVLRVTRFIGNVRRGGYFLPSRGCASSK